ncbi:hypothetical protein GUITHDRAFT_156260 [Guillardia theta CCMP2712]|uniref:Uncharacterized protein n=2 Tax=Guillardia theta TaxID=55529 RepID=L1I912_GUITC|nr:hypothetical protein GUITHDRAFT_156260 [Guillardia theta CCMP2712]EKX32718.1 hypothetical protein GUITHDRAFT_156260 [Guillardia theta CCMP2712]|eukprot:XP_005819698.1 hypothetical protein GUITHDRAFT_156260 [Guillardia theta CCMP2712]
MHFGGSKAVLSPVRLLFARGFPVRLIQSISHQTSPVGSQPAEYAAANRGTETLDYSREISHPNELMAFRVVNAPLMSKQPCKDDIITWDDLFHKNDLYYRQ